MEEQMFDIQDKEVVEESQKPELQSAKDAEEQGLSLEEIQAGQKHGIIAEESEEKESEESEEKPEEKPKEDDSKEEKPEEEESEEEESEDDKQTKDYNANEKALYFKQKKERKKRQEAEKERDYFKLQERTLQNRMDKIEERLDSANKSEEEDDEDRMPTMADLKRMDAEKEKKQLEAEQERVRQQQKGKELEIAINEQEQEAMENPKFPEFQKVTELATEVMNDDDSGTFRNQITLAASKADQVNVAELVYRIGQLHPDYQKVISDKTSKGDKDDGKEGKIDRMVANAGKRKPSAKIGGGSGSSRKVSEEDLTAEDVARLSQTDFGKLSSETRRRILKESCR